MVEAPKTAEAPEAIERDFKAKVAGGLHLIPEGLNRFVVVTPMTFDDGDVLPIVLKKEGESWHLTDEAHTFLQLSYRLDDEELEGPRREIIDKVLRNFEIENRKGELVLNIPDTQYGDALYTFIQALLKIDDIRYLSRDVQSTFVEDVKLLLEKTTTAPGRITPNWSDPERDKKGIYSVDFRVNGTRTPIFVYAVNSEHKADIATISLLKFDQWKLSYKSVGIFDEITNFNQRTSARLIDACGKVFTNLEEAQKGLARFVPELVTPES
jgi:hypothetical protein